MNLKRIINLFRREFWLIGVIQQPSENWTPEKTINPNEIFWMIAKHMDDFYADPFVTTYFGQPILFFENYDHLTKKGNISYIKISDLLSHKKDFEKYICPALDLKSHLSYPYLFEYDSKLYMVPENNTSNTISLYVCNGTPNSWSKVHTMIDDFRGVDPGIFYHNQKWWLTATKKVDGTRLEDSDLYLWYADTPLDTVWMPHERNPIHYAEPFARGAGSTFAHGSVLYHPTQDCKVRYGHRIVLNRIVELDKNVFSENIVTTLCGVKPYDIAFHTINNAGGVTVIDGKGEKYSLLKFYRAVISYFIKR